MNLYEVRTNVEYILLVEAESEEVALHKASDTDFHEWDQAQSEFTAELSEENIDG